MRPAINLFAILVICSSAVAQTKLEYSPAPVDNPLKGLVPYAGDKRDNFPHSMEFSYLPLSDLMPSRDQFDWQPLENMLNDIASRQHQTVFRIWMEYPGRDDGIPKWLESDGVKVTEWLNTNTAPFPAKTVRTPDYGDPKLQSALQRFIKELGKRYDGDPRIGYLTAGLLGTWGEWHTYPRTDLMPSKKAQIAVMDAFERHFQKTPVLLRYPAGDNNFRYAANQLRNLGYHDDSFAWATLDTGKAEDNWFFLPALMSAGQQAMDKWKTRPIGGEIRPELWGQIFDQAPQHSKAQDFEQSVRQTHATWLMDTGMFETRQSEERINNAKQQVRRMGYEFHVSEFAFERNETGAELHLKVRNTGVAPFYFDWKLELAALNTDGQVVGTFPTQETLQEIMPGTSRDLTLGIAPDDWPETGHRIAVRVRNPMPNGLPLRFANQANIQIADGWLKLAE